MTVGEALPSSAAVSLRGVMFVSHSAHGSLHPLSGLHTRCGYCASGRVSALWHVGSCASRTKFSIFIQELSSSLLSSD